MEVSVRVLASLLNGEIEGNPEVIINRPSRIEEGGEGSISFLGNSKYEHYVYSTTASALLVDRGFEPREPVRATLIRVDDVYAAVSFLLEKFDQAKAVQASISDKAQVDPAAHIGNHVFIGPFAVIEAGAWIGDGCQIGAQVYVGRNAVVGDETRLYPGVRILDDCQIGRRCILHANAVVGADGFGFAPQADGPFKKIPQIGNVILEDDVEIGANTTVDRASIGSTILRRGVKLDNLIQVAHNVEIGENTVIAALTGISGSVKIGKNCMIGGQVGFSGHIQVADGTKIQAQTGVASHVKEPGTALCGTPAIGYTQYIKAYSVFKQLPDLYKRFHIIEQRISNLP
jgi:UDP-3-O-[3-hydroxymyristoyl] glucosamine N-acyltransferase